MQAQTPKQNALHAIERLPDDVPLDEIVQQYGAGTLSLFSARLVYVRPGRLVVARARICPAVIHSPTDVSYLVLMDTGRAA